jgi:hypothetical protein
MLAVKIMKIDHKQSHGKLLGPEIVRTRLITKARQNMMKNSVTWPGKWNSLKLKLTKGSNRQWHMLSASNRALGHNRML